MASDDGTRLDIGTLEKQVVIGANLDNAMCANKRDMILLLKQAQ